MQPSEHFNYYSVSNINGFIDYRSRWYLERIKEQKLPMATPDPMRGQAVEFGINKTYQGVPVDEAIDMALDVYDQSTADLDIDDAAACRAPLAELIVCGVEALLPYGKLEGMQRKLVVGQQNVKGSHLPWIGYLDYVFEGGVIVDLKVTKRTPNGIPASHARQGAFYSTHTPDTTRMDFVYLVPLKLGPKSLSLTLENIEHHYRTLLAGMNAMQTILASIDEEETLDAVFTPSPSDWWLKDEYAKNTAKEVWSEIL